MMALRTDSRSTSIPDALFYRDKEKERSEAQSGCSSLCEVPLQAMGRLLRDLFYLPRYPSQIPPYLQLDQREGNRISAPLMNQEMGASKVCDAIRKHFIVRDIPVEIQGNTMTRIFTIRLFESIAPIQGKQLRVILFVFNDNRETREGGARRWEPLTIDELSLASLNVLKALKHSGIQVDSLMTNSLGNVMLDALKYCETEEERALIQKLLISMSLVVKPSPLGGIVFSI